MSKHDPDPIPTPIALLLALLPALVFFSLYESTPEERVQRSKERMCIDDE